MKTAVGTLLLVLHLLTCVVTAHPTDLQGRVEAEGMYFFSSSAYPGQQDGLGSLALEAEFFHSFPSGASVTIKPFARLDSSDSARNHADLRRCSLLVPFDGGQIVAGFDKVFWGVTEFVHLVDIINQTDLVESLDGEDKLGQPMLHLTTERYWGTVDAFLLPYFRERTFAGRAGRFRGPLVVDTPETQFESGAGKNHLDLALRYSNAFGNWDFGIYHFRGTSRDPLFLETDEDKDLLVPYYQQISQTGSDLQYTRDQWLYKLETLYQTSNRGDGGAITCGFEYTFFAIANTAMDVGLIGEYIYDSRETAKTSLYDNDIMSGIRLNINDLHSKELLVGVVRDTRRNSTVLRLEYSQRLGTAFKLETSAICFPAIDQTDPAYFYHKDSSVTLSISYYF
ncbi:MAG: hypothetical protein V2B20_03390 [Pseudomonadota bacterium]